MAGKDLAHDARLSEPVFKPRPRRARFTIQIRDHQHGDSLTLNLHPSPWQNRYLCAQGEFSAAHLGRVVTLLLTRPA